MGLVAEIMHGTTNCSNGGISATKKSVTIANVTGPWEPDDDRPAVLLVSGNVAGTVKIVPAARTSDEGYVATRGSMMGGTYIACADSRFAEAIEQLTGARFYGAVAFHDRFESAALSRELSA